MFHSRINVASALGRAWQVKSSLTPDTLWCARPQPLLQRSLAAKQLRLLQLQLPLRFLRASFSPW